MTFFTCRVGDFVLHKGKTVMVQHILEKGSEKKQTRAFIKCCRTDHDGAPLLRSNVYAGMNWSHR